MNLRKITSTICACALLAYASAAAAQDRAGEASRAQQNAFQWASLSPDRLSTGDDIYQNADVYTTDFGSLELTMDDGSILTLGPSTELKIDEFVYNPDNGAGSASLSIGRGILRMASGRIRSQDVKIGTPVATIGIRGTEFTVDTNTPGNLKVWSTEGTVIVSPNGTDDTYELVAPAFASCGDSSCELGDSPTLPYFFPIGPHDPTRPNNEHERSGGNDDPDEEHEGFDQT